jgi:tetratricopeptide (TPR) repeat protein
MRTLLLLSFIVIAFNSFSQELILARNTSSEPYNLFREASQSLDKGHTRQAVHKFEKIIEFYEHSGRQSELAQYYFGMALAFAFNENYRQSIRYHKKALRAHNRYTSSHPPQEILINLGLTYELAGRKNKAKKYLN